MKFVARVEVHPSKFNPRKHFDQVKLEELARSIGAAGMVEPLVVREAKNGKGYELAAGERRWRAASIAKLDKVPVLVRDLTDDQMLEIMVIENLQRDDLKPLEEARGFRQLIDTQPDKHNAESIATRIGKSPRHVWDRMKLLDLIAPAQALLETDRIQVGHAVLIARLKAEDQKRVLGIGEFKDAAEAVCEDTYRRRQGLWETDHSTSLFTDEEQNKLERSPFYGAKACSVRELEAWIARNVRFDATHAAASAPFLFEPAKTAVDEAMAQPGRGKKVVPITHEYRVPDGARAAERTFGSPSWKRADGQFKSKTCDHSVLGTVVAGPDYGATFQVCVAKDKCDVHWKAEKAARAKRAKMTAGRAKRSEESEEISWRKTEEERKARQAAWEKILPEILESIAAAVKKAKVPVVVQRALRGNRFNGKAKELLGVGAKLSAEDAIRVLALAECVSVAQYSYYGGDGFAKQCGPFGGGIGAIIKKAKAAEKADTRATKAKGKKKGRAAA